MKAVILFACAVVVLGTGLYFAEGFVRDVPRPTMPQRLDGISSIRLTTPATGPIAAAATEATPAERPVGTAGRERTSAAGSVATSAGIPVTPGQQVELKVRAEDINNDAAFAVGSGDNAMIVVMRRDTRTPEQDQEGVPPDHGIAPIDGGGHVVTIAGTIEKMPAYWEEMASWNLTRGERLLLTRKGVYVRADRVTPEGDTAAVTPAVKP